jgi:hypothetical protein
MTLPLRGAVWTRPTATAHGCEIQIFFYSQGFWYIW